MTKAKENVKTNKSMTEIEAIRKTPELTDYIVRAKIRDVRKSAIIVAILCAVTAFAGGFVLGTYTTKEAIPNNVVTIQVGEKAAAEEQGK